MHTHALDVIEYLNRDRGWLHGLAKGESQFYFLFCQKFLHSLDFFLKKKSTLNSHLNSCLFSKKMIKHKKVVGIMGTHYQCPSNQYPQFMFSWTTDKNEPSF